MSSCTEADNDSIYELTSKAGKARLLDLNKVLNKGLHGYRLFVGKLERP